MKKRKCSPLRMADGGVIPARPVSPFSLRGMAGAVGGAYNGLRNAAADGMMAMHERFGTPPGYTPAVAPAPVAAPQVQAPSPDGVQLGGMNLGVIQRREAAAMQGLRNGAAFLDGPGGPTDDKIPAKLSRGEAVLPADTVQAVGPENIQRLIDSTHTPVKHKGIRHYANGIDEVEDPRYPAGQQGPSVSTQLPADAPWYKQPSARVDPSLAPPAPTVTRGPSIPDISAPNVDLNKAKTQFMPNFQATRDMALDDVNRAAGRGDLSSAVGHALRGGLAMIPAALDDAFLGPGRELAKRFPGVNDQSINQAVGTTIRTAITGNDPVMRAAAAQHDEVAPPALPARDLPGHEAARVAPGTIERRGNSFTNTGEFAEDLNPNVGNISEQNSRAADALSAKYAGGLRGGFDAAPNLPAGYGATIPASEAQYAQLDLRSPGSLAARNASVRSTVGDRDLSPRTRVAMQEADTHARAVDLQDATMRRGQDVNADVAREGHRTTMRGQDLNYASSTRGQDMTARTAAVQARLQQMNTDRQYNLEREKFGEEKARTAYDQRERADKDLTSKLEAFHTTVDDKGNQVVDKARVAASKAAVTAHIGSVIDNLERVPESSPDYARSQQYAQELRQKGAAALTEDRLHQLLTQQEAKQRTLAARGYGPFSGTYVDSADPSGYDVVGRENGVFQDQYKLRNGSKVPTRTLDYDNGGNPILPNFIGNNRTDRFDPIKKGSIRNGY